MTPNVSFTNLFLRIYAFLFTAVDLASVMELSAPVHCISCTSLNADQLLRHVHDENWRHWLESIRFTPNSQQCTDPFEIVDAIRNGARSQPCENGVCLKMWIREGSVGPGHVWRSCIPNAEDKLRTDCTKIISSQGMMEVCTCSGNLCNGSFLLRGSSYFLLLLIVMAQAMIFKCLLL